MPVDRMGDYVVLVDLKSKSNRRPRLKLYLLGMTVTSGGVGASTLASKIMKMNPDWYGSNQSRAGQFSSLVVRIVRRVYTFNDVIVLIKLPLKRCVENRGLRKINPKEIRRKLPMLISTRLIRRGIQARILPPHGESITRDVVGGTIVNDPRHNRLEILCGFVQARPAVDKRRGLGQVRIGDVGTVVGYNGGSDVKDDACVVKDAGRSGAGVIACSEGLCKAVAEGCRMGAHPVICGLLICFDDDCVALTYVMGCVRKRS